VIAVDLFSGVGGFTTGAKLAGVRVGAAVDSWRDAVEAHLANHREVIHHEADLTDFDFDELPTHDLLLASPPCQGFSEASQPTRRPKHAKDRSCAWSVVHAAGECRPTTILVENVPGIQQWDKYQEWLASFQALGYHTWEHVFDTADFGVPQNRKRFILTARLGQVLALTSPALPHRPFRDYVDLCLPSVAVSGKPAGVQRRVSRAIGNGLHRHNDGRFLVHYSSDNAGRSLDRPIGTITTKAQWALAQWLKLNGQTYIRMLTTAELRRGMSFPSNYQLPQSKQLATKLLGNAIPPVFAQELCRQALTH
jgi:DNA (cytosine-5)-methyltransferase 1